MELSNVEKEFVLRALRSGRRVDGRGLLDRRRVKFSFDRNAERTSAEVCLGRTRVVTITTAEVVPPFPDRPTEGFINFNVELSPMASEAFEPGRPSPLGVEVGRIVERCLREARAIDTEALCIVAGEKVWSLRCDVRVIDDGGNIIDAAALSAVASLCHFRRADVSVQGERITIHSFDDRVPVPLSVHHKPICISFAIFPDDDTELVAVDPSDREELVMDGRMTLALNAHAELCMVHKLGAPAIAPEELLRCTKVAARQAEDLSELLARALEVAEKEAKAKDAAAHAAAAGYNLARMPAVAGGVFDRERADRAAAAAADAAKRGESDATGTAWLLQHSEARVTEADEVMGTDGKTRDDRLFGADVGKWDAEMDDKAEVTTGSPATGGAGAHAGGSPSHSDSDDGAGGMAGVDPTARAEFEAFAASMRTGAGGDAADSLVAAVKPGALEKKKHKKRGKGSKRR